MDTTKTVVVQPNLINSAIYSVTGVLGMQVAFNEFVMCNDYRSLFPALIHTGNKKIDDAINSIFPLANLSCLNSSVYNVTLNDPTMNATTNAEGIETDKTKILNTNNLMMGSFGIPQHLSNPALQYLGPNLFDNIWFGFCVPLLFMAG